MLRALTVQYGILGQFVQRLSAAGQRTDALPLGFALRGTAQAMLLLRLDCHLNEAQVLMRLLVERAINLCFCLTVNADEKPGKNDRPTMTGTEAGKRRVSSAEELIEATKDYQFKESYDTEGLERKIAVLHERAGIPDGFLRLAVASYYPKASAALSGSAVGAVCHIQDDAAKDPESYFQQEFSSLFFTSSLLLHHAIQLLAKQTEAPELLAQSTESFRVATDLMNKIK
jgi:hypothetical protein